MKAKGLPTWIVAWLVVDVFIIFWDASFVLMRPASLPGGSLGQFWTLGNTKTGFGYAVYVRADKMYGDVNNSWVWAQSIGNLIEMVFQIYAIIIRHSSSAHFWAFAVSLCTFFKTVLYFLVCVANPAAAWTTDMGLWLSGFLLPNSFWLGIPLVVIFVTGKTILRSLHAAPIPAKEL